MEPNITQIKELRNCTGCSPSDAKKALQLNECNLNKSIEYLRKQGIVKTKIETKPTTQGLIAIGISKNAVSMLEVLTETDFTAMNEFIREKTQGLATDLANGCPLAENNLDDLIKRTGENIVFGRHFLRYEDPKSFGIYLHSDSKLGVVVEFSKNVDYQFGKDVAMHIAATNPLAVSRENISKAFLEKETEIFKENAAKSGKPLAIIDKIVIGQVNALLKEKSLEDQLFVKDTSKTIKQLLDENGVKINAFARWRVGDE